MSTNMETAIEFANKVRNELRHLTTEQIADLTDGLEADIASSLDDGADIGSAEKYATDLLAAAGLSADEAASTGVLVRVFRDVSEKFRTIVNSVSDLAPAWWVLRAWGVTQFIGMIVNRHDTASTAFLEWRQQPFVGLVLFAVLLVASVRWGRSQTARWKLATNISHVLLGFVFILMTFSSPRTSLEWVEYGNPQPGVAYCTRIDTPAVVGLTVAEAKAVLGQQGLSWTFFDQDAMVDLADVPDDAIVLQTNPRTGEKICQVYTVQMVVDLSLKSPRPTVLPEEMTTTSTSPIAVMGTTTTTVKSKATTTTKP